MKRLIPLISVLLLLLGCGNEPKVNSETQVENISAPFPFEYGTYYYFPGGQTTATYHGVNKEVYDVEEGEYFAITEDRKFIVGRHSSDGSYPEKKHVLDIAHGAIEPHEKFEITIGSNGEDQHYEFDLNATPPTMYHYWNSYAGKKAWPISKITFGSTVLFPVKEMQESQVADKRSQEDGEEQAVSNEVNTRIPMICKTSKLNVRDKPSMSGEKIGQLNEEDYVDHTGRVHDSTFVATINGIETEGSFIEIILPDSEQEGWVFSGGLISLMEEEGWDER